MMKRYLSLITLCAASFLAAQDDKSGPPPAPAQSEAPRRPMNMPDPNKPAGEAFKNVQLLKDVPAGQFFQAMRVFSASLGVRCDFCHVEGNFASDDKPEKKMARTMITMVHTVNQQFFNGKPEVQCYTCHRGSSQPVSTPPAPPAGARPGFGPPPGPGGEQAPPPPPAQP